MTNLDYLYNPDAAKPYLARNYFVDDKLGFQVIEHGIVLPHKDSIVDGKWTWGKGGIVDSKGEFIKESHVHYGVGKGYTPPMNQFNTVPKPSFTLECFFLCGGIS